MTDSNQHSELFPTPGAEYEDMIDLCRDIVAGWVAPNIAGDVLKLRMAQAYISLFEQFEGGAGLIAQERRRQVESEGWDAGHDDAHNQGEMAKAAAAYALVSYGSAHAYEYWPWHADWWRPTDRIGTLVKAGALIAAEIDRLQRVSNPASEQGCAHDWDATSVNYGPPGGSYDIFLCVKCGAERDPAKERQ